MGLLENVGVPDAADPSLRKGLQGNHSLVSPEHSGGEAGVVGMDDAFEVAIGHLDDFSVATGVEGDFAAELESGSDVDGESVEVSEGWHGTGFTIGEPSTEFFF